MPFLRTSLFLSGWLAAPLLAEPVISEFMADNRSTFADEDGDRPDWIEIYNPDSAAADLGGWRLTDDASKPAKWTFPSLPLASGARLVVFASGKNRAVAGATLHTNFSLKSEGEFLALVRPDMTVAHAFVPGFPAMDTDRSFGPAPGGNQFFLTPTPGLANSAPAGFGFVKPVTLSLAHGFFSAPVTVALSTATPGANIVYTIDGTTPTTSTGIAYVQPLIVARTTVLRAAAFRHDWTASPVATQTYFFLDDVIHQSANSAPPPGWPPGPVGPQVLDYGMDPNVVDSHEAEVGNSLLAVPTISLVTDLANLLDPATGIYVNPDETGDEWERPVSVELLNHPAGSVQVNAGLRIRGGFSRQADNPKHSLRLSFRGVYGADRLRFPLFGESGASEFDGLDLPTSQDYSWSYLGSDQNSMLRDPWLRDTMRDMGAAHTRSFYCHVYLNGQYWGVHHAEERPEAAWGATYLGGKKEDYDCVKSTGLSGGLRIEVTDGSMDAWQNLWTQARAHAADPSNTRYFKMQGLAPDGLAGTADPVLLEVDALADYLLTCYYGNCSDAPVTIVTNNQNPNNFFMLRRRDGPRGFIYFIHDGEQSLDSPGGDRTGPFIGPNQNFLAFSNPQWLHQDLVGNAEYRLRFADRVQRHFFGGVLEREKCIARLDQRAAQVGPAMLAESARWGDAQGEPPLGPVHWLIARDAIRNGFFTNRRDTVLTQLRLDGLWPSLEAPTMTPLGGSVPLGTGIRFSAPAGQIYYTIDGPDPRQAGGAVDPAAVAYADGVLPVVTLLDGSETWTYLDDGTDQRTTWNEMGFMPAQPPWKSGGGEFGYGEGDEETAVEDNPTPGYEFGASNRYFTHYFRTRFTSPPPGTLSSVKVEVLRDDGAIVYLNGGEVARSNMPDGPVDYLTPASTLVVGDEERTFYPYEIDPGRLHEGTNVMAVEVHQGGANTADMSFKLKLTGRQAPLSPPALLAGPAVRRVKTRVLHNDQWSPLVEAEFLVGAEIASTANLLVSEIHFHPAASGEEAFIELQNVGPRPVDLRGVRLAGAVSFEFPATSSLLGPGQRVVVVENAAVFTSRYGGVVPLAGEFSGLLPAGAGEVRLVSAALSLIEAVPYRADAPWPDGLNGEGFSLTRVAPARHLPAYAPSSWRISRALGGSPGESDSLDYASWKADHQIDSDGDDRDGDGLPALMEYAFGGDPDLPDTTLGPSLGIFGSSSGRYVILVLSHRLGADDVSLTVETSTDLAAWRPPSLSFIRQSRSGSGHIAQEFTLATGSSVPGIAFRCRVAVVP